MRRWIDRYHNSRSCSWDNLYVHRCWVIDREIEWQLHTQWILEVKGTCLPTTKMMLLFGTMSRVSELFSWDCAWRDLSERSWYCRRRSTCNHTEAYQLQATYCGNWHVVKDEVPFVNFQRWYVHKMDNTLHAANTGRHCSNIFKVEQLETGSHTDRNGCATTYSNIAMLAQ